MKKFLIITVLSITLHTVTSAQITKGTVLLGGNFNTSINKYESNPRSRSTYYALNPSLGFALKDNHVAGLDLSFRHNNNTQQQGRDEQDTYYAGVFYRRYLPLGKGFYLFGQGNVGYSLTDADAYSHQTFAGSRARQHSAGISLYPGIAYTVNRRIHLELAMSNLITLNYTTGISKNYSPTYYSETKNSGVSLSTNANPQTDLTVGFRIALGK